ncbi:Hemolymph lipopolysaccharide-binding protein [Gryllus bimaculatus]|nr:Hemolymph lipopolysaccharide-binding protein [Gryllus bimaculatus]
MALRAALVLLTVAHWCVAAVSDDAEGWCERVCSGTRPTCPPVPPPACPVPVCPPPVVNLSCPEPRCPVPAPCPSCPVPPPCPSCPTCAAPPTSPTPTSLTVPSAASRTPQAAAPFFPYGYLRYSNLGVYKFYPEAEWLEANATCTADGAHLAPEVDLLLYIMERRNAKKAFIGFHDYYYEGNYRTVLGKEIPVTVPEKAIKKSLHVRWFIS